MSGDGREANDALPPSRLPRTDAERVEVADMRQALVGDDVDPLHHSFKAWFRPQGDG